MANGWQIVPLGQILKRADRFEKKNDLQTYHFAGTYSFARGIFAGERKEGTTFRLDKIQRIRKGDFIYCKIMAWEGAFGIAPEQTDNCVMSGAFVVYEINQSRVEPKFLQYYFKQEAVWKSIGSQSTGTNVRRRSLHPHQFEKAVIPLPPLAEQRRIVARIEALAARIAAAQALRRDAENEAETFWHSSLNKIFQRESDSNLLTLEEICRAIIDNLHSTPKYDGDNFPCIRSQDIGWGTLNYSTALRVSDDEFKQRIVRGEPQTNDIVFVREGDVGRCCIVDGNQRFCLGQRVMLLRPDPQIVEPKLLMYQLMSPPILQEQLLEGMTGTTSKHLNIGRFRKVKFIIPSLNKQRRIVAYLDGLQAKVAALRGLQEAAGRELDALLPAVLDRAFKGGL